MDGPFHGQKPLVHLLHPHYPQRRSGQGVRGHSPGGESDRGAPVPRNAATWRNRPRLPSKACKLTGSLRPARHGYPAGSPSQGPQTVAQG